MSNYPATERRWVGAILRKLTPAQRAEYVERCRMATRHPSSGRLYDGERARIAEAILARDMPRRGALDQEARDE